MNLSQVQNPSFKWCDLSCGVQTGRPPGLDALLICADHQEWTYCMLICADHQDCTCCWSVQTTRTGRSADLCRPPGMDLLHAATACWSVQTTRTRPTVDLCRPPGLDALLICTDHQDWTYCWSVQTTRTGPTADLCRTPGLD